ncbi:hypothetical protein E0I26_03985 [Flavobacterium rhamnosiphilum]|uniref:Outer membrane protein beta-barrel domain-containing protein n=1 Tax=Flavobacterium rhamnosiphilum TaxID=2541724 RepID=A0A4R5FB66_9FLAO|nr:hypothetical protein [Flavobacterium rhamnosiphilum]TDE45856.1 hypothetical protein E0I26_03985 [Flavobacterium rhamnosiphilum]
MKKIILSAAAVFAFGFANAQEGNFKLGAHVGLPMGDFKDSYSVNLGADVAYVWNVADKFSAGVTTGYTTYLGKTIGSGVGSFEVPNAGFIPLAATGQYSISDDLFLGADLGYAIYAGSGDGDGGFLYQPKFGYQTEKFEVYAGYKGISNNGTLSSINLGFNYKF